MLCEECVGGCFPAQGLCLPVLLGTTGQAKWQCPAPRGFSHTNTKRGKRLLTRRITTFPETNIPLSSLSLKVVNIVENVVHPLALQNVPQILTLHLQCLSVNIYWVLYSIRTQEKKFSQCFNMYHSFRKEK